MNLALLEQSVILYALVFSRLAGMMSSAPIFDSKHFPMRVKIILLFLLSIIIVSLFPTTLDQDFIQKNLILLMLQETLLGFLMGFVFKIIFEIFMMSGQILAMQAGLGFALLTDPQNGIQIPVIGELYFVAVTFMFLISNSHLILIYTLSNSFAILPIDTFYFSQLDLNTLFTFSKVIFMEGVLIVLPAIVTMLIINFTLAIMTRAAPQLNIFTIGFPIMLIAGLCMIYLTFHQITNGAVMEFKQGFDVIQTWLR